MLQTELIFFVQRDNHIILFLYINIERGVLVVFSALAAFFGIFSGLISVSFHQDSVPVPGFVGKNWICFSVFIVFFLWQHFLLFIFREDSFPVPSEMSHFRFWFKRQNFEFVAVDISVLTGFFFGSFFFLDEMS